MTQDRKGAAHDPHDLDVTGFGLGLGDMGEDPSEMFAAVSYTHLRAHET